MAQNKPILRIGGVWSLLSSSFGISRVELNQSFQQPSSLEVPKLTLTPLDEESHHDKLKGKKVVAFTFITTNYWQLSTINMLNNLSERWRK